MSTLREVIENPALHAKLSKLKIETSDNCLYHYSALSKEVQQVLWACDTIKTCEGLVTTDYDGVLINTVDHHSSFCPKFKPSEAPKAKKPVTPNKNSGKMKEMLVEIGSLSNNELHTGILEPSVRQRCLMPVPKGSKLPDTIPVAYDRKIVIVGQPKPPGVAVDVDYFEKLCRMCGLKKSHLTSIKSYDGSNVGLKVKLEWLLGKQINFNDSLPTKLCHMCVKNLTGAHHVYISALKAQNLLINLLAAPRIKKEKDVVQKEEEKQSSPAKEAVPKSPAVVKIKKMQTTSPKAAAAKVPCKSCPETFMTESLLYGHTLTHHINEALGGEKPRPTHNNDLLCRLCDEKCLSSLHLIKHYRKIHDMFYCERCKDFYQDKMAMEEHITLFHDQQPTYCIECDEVFRCKLTEENHKELFHSNKPNISCDFCQRQFVTKFQHADHMKLHLGKRNFQCSRCGKTFVTHPALSNHLRTHSREFKFQCHHCPKTFTMKKYLTHHMKMHHISAWYYRCMACGLEKSDMDEISQHCTSMHGDKTTVARLSHAVCRYCGELQPNWVLLQKHIYKKHRATPKSVTFLSPKSPKAPELIYTTFKCRICDKPVKTKAALQVHMQCVHGDKKFKCKLCPTAQFTYEALLLQHEKTRHSIDHFFRCSVCEIQFDSHRKLAKHIDNAHKKKTKMCAMCDKGFASDSTLREHLKTHEVPLETSMENVIKITLLGADGAESLVEVVS